MRVFPESVDQGRVSQRDPQGGRAQVVGIDLRRRDRAAGQRLGDSPHASRPRAGARSADQVGTVLAAGQCWHGRDGRRHGRRPLTCRQRAEKMTSVTCLLSWTQQFDMRSDSDEQFL